MERTHRIIVSRLLIAATVVLTAVSCWTVTDRMSQAAGGDLVIKSESSKA
ncbi:hypothetical protein [Ramlibacter sp.]|nr:hypothetical protein [Ramlibacter sp.]MBA2674991.1 hypothetical protein [Ramlibacter sp.]